MRLKNNIKYIATLAKVFMTALILLLALLIIQSIIVETERTFASTRLRQKPKPAAELTPEEQQINRIRDSEKEFLPDGTIQLVYTLKRIPGQENQSDIDIVQIYDINNKLLWEGPRYNKPYEYLSWAEQLREYRVGFTWQRMKELQMIQPVLSRNIEIPVGLPDKPEQIWRYNPTMNYFTGYDTDGNKIGYISSIGFTESKANAKPFGQFRYFTAWCPQDSSNPTLLWQTQRCIYQIDFEKRQAELLFESTDSDIDTISLHGWRDLFPGSDGYVNREKYRPLLNCVTKDGKNHSIMREPEQRLTITFPEDWKNWLNNSYRFTATRQEILLYRRWIEVSNFPDYRKSPKLNMEWWRNFRSQPQKHWIELYKVDNQARGELVESSNLELLNRYTWTEPGQSESVKLAEYRMIMPRIMNKFSSPLYDWLWHLSGIKFWRQLYQRTDFAYSFARLISYVRPGDSVINWLLSAAMMGFVLWHGWPRRTTWLKFLFWLAFVGIFNLAGLLTYLALNHTTVIKCPACGRRRGLAQVDCARCGVELPAPKRGKLDLILSS
jgi:hypothetical protein